MRDIDVGTDARLRCLIISVGLCEPAPGEDFQVLPPPAGGFSVIDLGVVPTAPMPDKEGKEK